MLEVVAQTDERDGLPREVAVLAPPGDLVMAELGLGVPERRDLGVLVHLRLPPLGGHSAHRATAVDQRDGPADVAGQVGDDAALQCRAVAAGELVAARDEAADGLVDPAPGAGKQPDLLEHDQRRDGEGAYARAGLGDVVGHADHRGAPCLAEAGQLAAAADDDDVGSLDGRLTGGLDRLLGVARERDRKDQRAFADERRQLVGLGDDHGNGHERSGDGRDDVARDAAAAHTEHDDGVDVVDRGQPLQADGPLGRRRHLLGQRQRGRQHALGVGDLGPVDRHADDSGKVGLMPSASALAIRRWCSSSETVSASSMSMMGMSSRMA